jgi:hypothetical protein
MPTPNKSPLYFKNVKCQNNSRENDSFHILFCSSHSQWVRSSHKQLVFGSIAFKLFNLAQTFQVAFNKLPTISWVNFDPFLLTEVVLLSIGLPPYLSPPPIFGCVWSTSLSGWVSRSPHILAWSWHRHSLWSVKLFRILTASRATKTSRKY